MKADENKQKPTYVISEQLLRESCKISNLKNRPSLVHSLIANYNLLNYMEIVPSVPATEEELLLFHSNQYIDYLKKLSLDGTKDGQSENVVLPDTAHNNEDIYGIGYDCPLINNIYSFVRVIAGGTITAASCLAQKKSTVAINWCGGWHHAQKDKAEGFCYVNDIVLGIERLRTSFRKILYIDLDVHHGDAVEEAYRFSQDVLTLSLHKYEPGFYPGTGSLNDVGSGTGKYYSVNVPLKEGITDDAYFRVFSKIAETAVSVFSPHAVVVQCGADCLTGDKLGGFNLTPKGIGLCVRMILSWNKPTLFLGGGGYNEANVARCWTYLTSIIVNYELEDDIPENLYFEYFGPDFTLQVAPSYMKDLNDDRYIQSIIESITRHLRFLSQRLYTYLVITDHKLIKA